MTAERSRRAFAVRSQRADAQRNRETVLTAAAEVFVTSGVDAPIRQIAAQAGVGMATIYRHFPTRATSSPPWYQHQIEACAEAGPHLLAGADTPADALRQWIDLFVDFLVTKHGLADALQSASDRFAALHACFLDRLASPHLTCRDVCGTSSVAERVPGPTGQPSRRVAVVVTERRGWPVVHSGACIRYSGTGLPAEMSPLGAGVIALGLYGVVATTSAGSSPPTAGSSSPDRSPGAWSSTATAPTATTSSAPWSASPAWP